MRQLSYVILALTIFSISCTNKPSQIDKTVKATIKVGVFDGHGGAQTCVWEAVEAIKIDKEMDVRLITTSDIANGCLDSLDAIIIPGGGGSRQYLNLGYKNQERIRSFVINGGGAVGICAGAYFFSNTPNYACVAMNGAQAIDIEHDNRGHGLVKFTLTKEGKSIFPELAARDTNFLVYYEGPVFINAPDSITYSSLATMESDVHEEGDAPANMTNAKPFFIGNNFGKGRVFSSIAHPEATPGMRWLIPRMVRWTLNKAYVTYNEKIVRPALFGKEILFNKDMLKRESNCYTTFLYGSPEEKIEALNWLESNVSWDAKRWVQGLLFDSSVAVRTRAAEYIANSEFTHYLPDVRVAQSIEKDKDANAKMAASLKFLEEM